MTLVQAHFRVRGDSEPLNSVSFESELDQQWTQFTDRSFRVRFDVEETAGSASTVGGTLEFSYNGGTWSPVTSTSGTVSAIRSDRFTEGAATCQILTARTPAFSPGYGSQAGTATVLSLNAQRTEHEYSLHILGADVTSGTVSLRIAGLTTYLRTPAILIGSTDLARVRLKIGDTDSQNYKLTDAQVQTFLSEWPENVDLAAANAAEAIAGLYSEDFDFQADGQSYTRSQKVNQYQTLAAELRKRGAQMALSGQ